MLLQFIIRKYSTFFLLKIPMDVIRPIENGIRIPTCIACANCAFVSCKPLKMQKKKKRNSRFTSNHDERDYDEKR